MQKEILIGNEAIVRGSLAAGVDFVSGYPGCPAAEIGDEFGKIAKKYGVYFEWSVNEKVALEAAIGASFSGLKSLVNMKSFGINVCSDSLLPLAYTGTKAPMVIVVADDPSCHSSAQSEQDSRGYAYLSHIPILEPSDPQECYDFTKLGFEISEKFKIPVILRTTTRVNHQRMPVKIDQEIKPKNKKLGEFIKNPHQFCTMPPRVLAMKKELLEKIEKITDFAEKSKINKEIKNSASGKFGIIASGIAYLHAIEAVEELGLDVSILKLGFFYPLPKKKIADFISPARGLKQILIVEETDPYLEKEVKVFAKEINSKVQIFGKNVLPEIGELNPEKVAVAVAKIKNLKFKNYLKTESPVKIPRRTARLCEGCPYWHVFPLIKRMAPEGTIFGGDIGCNMIAGLPPHNMQDYVFAMGAGLGISHGVAKSITLVVEESPAKSFNNEKSAVGSKKVISIMGDGTFFHSGINPLVNAVFNKSNPLLIILDNRITAMTGHQQNPGMGKNGMGEPTEELKIEEIVRACGVKNIKIFDPINIKEFEGAIKEFLPKDEVSVIICKRICALLEKRQKAKQH